MTDDLIQQATQSVPAMGVGGMGGVVLALITGMKMFARPADVELAKAELRAEMAEKYAHKEDLSKLGEDITYIRQRIDQIADRK